MAQTFPTFSASDAVATQLAGLKSRTEALVTSFSGATAPTMVDGQLFYDTDDHKLYYQRDGVLREVGSRLSSNLDLNADAAGPKQIVSARLENTVTSPTPSADEVGRIILHTGESRPKVVVSATKLSNVWVAGSGDYLAIDLPLGAWIKGSTPPTDATKGLAAGWLFDATGEFALISVRVPQAYSGTGNLYLRLFTTLNQNETDGDDEEWTLKVVTRQPDNAESLVGATETTATVAENLSTATGVDDGDVHVLDITLDYDDVDNPILAGDLMFLKLSRTEVTNVGGVILLRAHLLIEAPTKGTE